MRRSTRSGSRSDLFSDRLSPHGTPNALTIRLAELRAGGADIIDLTESNPTCVGIEYPPRLLDPLAAPAGLRYEPHPLGLEVARAAVAAECGRRGSRIEADRVVLTASTSEAYAWLFKLFCNPGDSVLVPRPGYPLFEHLTQLEGVAAEPYDLEYHGRWSIDFASVARASDAVRALVLVSPNNPTGSFVTAGELARVLEICANRRWALVADEVFADYPLDEELPLTDLAARSEVLAFSLGGLSKSAGLPQLKAGWIVVGGPPDARTAAMDRLELIADSFLSVNTPVQLALPQLLERAAAVRASIHGRVRTNLSCLRQLAARFPSCDVLRVDGGWSSVIRVPATRSEDDLVLELLNRRAVLVHPGYFFEFPREAFLVVSLLPDPARFVEGIARAFEVVNS